MSSLYPFFGIIIIAIIGWHYKRRSVWAPIILVCLGLLNYTMPPFSGHSIPFFSLGLMLCMAMLLSDMIICKTSNILTNNTDSVIFQAVLIFSAFIAMSVMLMRTDASLLGRLNIVVDASLLFFISLPCIKTCKDRELLLKGILVGVTLMVFIGLIGFALDDPWWGHTVYPSDEAIIESRAMTNLDYFEKLKKHIYLQRQVVRSDLDLRPRFSVSDPNSLAITILLVFPIIVYFWLAKRSTKKRLAIICVFSLMSLSVLLSGSRTAIIVGIAVFLHLIWMLFHTKHIKKYQVMLLLLVFVGIAGYATTIDDFGRITLGRFSQIDSMNSVLDANGRLWKWKYHFSNISPSLFIIGTSQSGVSGGDSTLAHMNYIALIYRGGIPALLAFLCILYKSIKNALRLPDRVLGLLMFASLLAYVLAGITQEVSMGNGPSFVFWPMIAILAKTSIR